ncbi:MAG: SulP family inorganic anion transporter [Flavobacteriia bacterium]|nr:SulP family inorganic anion transporter [Flavobacteriia bacterium]
MTKRNSLKWKLNSDLLSGFMVFLIALPLSLGIAKASGFNPAMGVLSAIIGGLFTTIFNVSPLTIKGPAAGLITISSAALIEFSSIAGESEAFKIVGTLIVIMAVMQIILGFLKLGVLSDFFPHSAVHGMLAAIGIIIIAKQIPVLLGDDPRIYKNETAIELIFNLPKLFVNAHMHIATVGFLALIILFALPKIKKGFIKKIPAPLFVLLICIPMSIYWSFKNSEGIYSLVQIGDFWNSIQLNFNLDYILTFVFWKYVIMFLFVCTIESLLTVKAIDNLSNKSKSNYNGELIGQGAGNIISGILGGLPMISEVVRSTSNVNFGAKSKFSNFFHGLFLLISMLLFIPVIELIPNAALAALLIYAGFRLAAPKEFIHMYKIGKEQLIIFLVTILVTLLEDLLIGILAGILVKIIFHLINGATIKSLFKTNYEINIIDENETKITILEVAVFSNILFYKKLLSSIDSPKICIDFKKTKLIDHSFLSFITYLKNEYLQKGVQVKITGIDFHKSFSKHPLATRVLKKKSF